jgi:hypothetical protein
MRQTEPVEVVLGFKKLQVDFYRLKPEKVLGMP